MNNVGNSYTNGSKEEAAFRVAKHEAFKQSEMEKFKGNLPPIDYLLVPDKRLKIGYKKEVLDYSDPRGLVNLAYLLGEIKQYQKEKHDPEAKSPVKFESNTGIHIRFSEDQAYMILTEYGQKLWSEVKQLGVDPLAKKATLSNIVHRKNEVPIYDEHGDIRDIILENDVAHFADDIGQGASELEMNMFESPESAGIPLTQDAMLGSIDTIRTHKDKRTGTTHANKGQDLRTKITKHLK